MKQLFVVLIAVVVMVLPSIASAICPPDNFDDFEIIDPDDRIIPEPTSLALLGTGLFGLFASGVLRKKR